MKLEDYRFANCELFRTPPLDLSVVERAIEEMLLESWKNGGTAGRTISSILENEEVVGKLTDQIAKNLEYQRAKELENLGRRHADKVSGYDEEHARKIQEVEATLGAEEKARRDQLAQLDGTLQQQRQVYTAAQSDLEERRRKIRERLKAMGGREKFETLIKINESLQNPQPQTQNPEPQTNYQPSTTHQPTTSETKTPQIPAPVIPQAPAFKPSPTLVYTPNPAAPVPQPVKKPEGKDSDLEKALDLALGEGTVDPLKGKTVEYLQKKEVQLADRPGFFKKVWKKTWEVLHYKIW